MNHKTREMMLTSKNYWTLWRSPRQTHGDRGAFGVDVEFGSHGVMAQIRRRN